MAGQAQLRCAALNIVLILPWWPTDVSRTLSARNVSELERADHARHGERRFVQRHRRRYAR